MLLLAVLAEGSLDAAVATGDATLVAAVGRLVVAIVALFGFVLL
jgi:hypothetical protein